MIDPLKSKIEFTPFLIENSSQIAVYIWEPVISGSLLFIVCVFVRRRSGTAYVVTIGTTISPSCAQPSEKEISDFVFENGKGAAHFCAHKICIYTNNVVFIKYRNQISNKKTTPPIIVCLQNFAANLLKYVKIKSYKHFYFL